MNTIKLQQKIKNSVLQYNMNNKNKNIKRDILQIVSNRLKNNNQSLHYSRSSCHQCISSNKTLEKVGQQHNKMNLIQNSIKKQKQLSINSTVYSIQILSANLSKRSSSPSSPARILKIISKKSQDKQRNSNDQQINKQQAKKMIKQWIQFSLRRFQSKQSQIGQKNINLPLQKQEDMKSLRKKIESIHDFKVFHSLNSLMGESQQIQSNFFKKQNKFVTPNESSQKYPALISQSQISSIIRKDSSPCSKNSSLKLLQSISTLPSQKILTKKVQQNNSQKLAQDLIRMLYIQALSIQSFLS